jgi:excisionase family DNA binding protein
MNLVSDEPIALKTPATLLDLIEVAKWLGVSAAWVREHATRKEPRLRAVKVGKLLRFRPEDVEEFLQRWTQ